MQGAWRTAVSSVERSTIGTWLRKELSCFNFQQVTCINEDQFVEEHLQFHVPCTVRDTFPKNGTIGDRTFRIHHALAYAPPVHSTARPPTEHSVHEHWKLSVKQSSSQRRGHLNAIEKVENSNVFSTFVKSPLNMKMSYSVHILRLAKFHCVSLPEKYRRRWPLNSLLTYAGLFV